jgi:hypothetical protein
MDELVRKGKMGKKWMKKMEKERSAERKWKKSTSPKPMGVRTHHPPPMKMDFLPPELFKTSQITPKAVLKNHSKSQKIIK